MKKSELELLGELDAQYKRLVAVRHTSVWGGTFEREHGAAMEIKPIVNGMFDTLTKLMEARAEHEQKKKCTKSPATGSVLRCWAHFGWETVQDRKGGITGHVPHLAGRRDELRSDDATNAIVPVEIRVLMEARE